MTKNWRTLSRGIASKFDRVANHSMMLMNMLKKSLVEVRKTKATVENTTSTNPSDDLATMVLNEVTDSEKTLETYSVDYGQISRRKK